MIPYNKLTLFEKLQFYLFDDNEKVPEHLKFSEKELIIKKRYTAVFSYWLEKPTLSEKKIVDFMVSELGICRSGAYKDLPNIKILLSNVRNANKEWQRYKLIAMLDNAYAMAEKSGDIKSMIQVADKLGRYTQLDKEDIQKVPYNEIIPQSFEPTDDVTVLGEGSFKNLKERQKKLREKYGGSPIEDISYEMVENDKSEKE